MSKTPQQRPIEVAHHSQSLSREARTLLVYSDDQLAHVDPLEMNLLVAKEIPALAHLDVASYTQQADRWAADIRTGLRQAERQFAAAPGDWKNDISFFRLGFLCYYVDEVLGIR